MGKGVWASEQAPAPLTTAGGFRLGLLGDALNPKVGLFYTTVFPQFIAPGDPVVPAAATLVAVHAAVLLIWYPSISFLITRVSRVVRRPRLAAWAERAMGSVLIVLGIRVAVTPR